ncbi:MAG: hypothetical protein HQK53_13380 [Oligoflexia bacterium]|nr:hypothetical protein [Oligoflexia bacterium]
MQIKYSIMRISNIFSYLSLFLLLFLFVACEGGDNHPAPAPAPAPPPPAPVPPVVHHPAAAPAPVPVPPPGPAPIPAPIPVPVLAPLVHMPPPPPLAALPAPMPVPMPMPAPAPVPSPCGQVEEVQFKLQEAIWICAESGDVARVASLKAQLEGILRSNNYLVWPKPTGMGGAAPKVILKYYDPTTFQLNGIEALFKKEQQGYERNSDPASEEAAYKLDELLNIQMVPMTVQKNLVNNNLGGAGVLNVAPALPTNVSVGDRGSVQYFVRLGLNNVPLPPSQLTLNPHFLVLPALPAGVVIAPGMEPLSRTASEYPPIVIGGIDEIKLNAMQVFDYIIGNPDRYNGGNFYTWGGRRIVAIDHSGAFRQYCGGVIKLPAVVGGWYPRLFSRVTVNQDPDLNDVSFPGQAWGTARTDYVNRLNVENLGFQPGSEMYPLGFDVELLTPVGLVAGLDRNINWFFVNLEPRVRAKILAPLTRWQLNQMMNNVGTDPLYRHRVLARFDEIVNIIR